MQYVNLHTVLEEKEVIRLTEYHDGGGATEYTLRRSNSNGSFEYSYAQDVDEYGVQHDIFDLDAHEARNLWHKALILEQAQAQLELQGKAVALPPVVTKVRWVAEANAPDDEDDEEDELDEPDFSRNPFTNFDFTKLSS